MADETSFSPTIPLPPKKHLTFDVDLTTVPSDSIKLVELCQHVAESRLYSWTDFPVTLPPSTFCSESDEQKATEKLNEPLFQVPNFDELSKVARDETGNFKKLSPDQLVEVRRTGQFSVPSQRFTGENHVWRLNRLLQKGTENTAKQLWGDISVSALFVVLWAKNRLISDAFSIRSAIWAILEGFIGLLDLIFGISHTHHGNMDDILKEQRRDYLTRELRLPKSSADIQLAYLNQYERMLGMFRRDRTEFIEKSGANCAPPPYVYLAPGWDGSSAPIVVDLRLQSSELQSQVRDIIERVHLNIGDDWLQRFKKKRVEELRNEGKKDSAILTILEKEAPVEYMQELFRVLIDNEELNSIHPQLGCLVVETGKFHTVVLSVLKEVDDERTEVVNQAREKCHRENPIMSELSDWVSNKLKQVRRDFLRKNRFTTHERILKRCKREGLDNFAYFVQKDMEFCRDREPELRRQLLKRRFPEGRFSLKLHWQFVSWWKVFLVEGVQEDENTYSFDRRTKKPVTPKFLTSDEGEETRPFLRSKYMFVCREFSKYQVNTAQTCWRLRYFLLWMWVWTWNSLQFCWIYVPVKSSVGLCALFGIREFYPHWTFNPSTGHIYPDSHRVCLTLCARIRLIWTFVLKSRHDFESAPPNGLLDKSLTRPLHYLWCYVCVGVMGTVMIGLGMPVLCLISSLLAILIGVLVPVLIPLLGLVYFMFTICIWDGLKAASKHRKLLVHNVFPLLCILLSNFLLRVMQIITCMTLSLLVLPLAAVFWYFVALLRFSIRCAWDTLFFHLVLKRKARIPAADHFLARRISGPGLAADYFYQASGEQVLLTLLLELERVELDLCRRQYRQLLEMPKREFQNFVSDNFGVFSMELANKGRYEQVLNEDSDWASRVEKLFSKRESILSKALCLAHLNKVKLPDTELARVMQLAEPIVGEFYNRRIEARLEQLQVDISQWWQEEHHLSPRDYSGYAAFLLTQVFGTGFFLSLENSTRVLKFEVSHVSTKAYLDMVCSSAYRLDLDKVVPLLRRDREAEEDARRDFHQRRDYLHLKMPHVDFSHFLLNKQSVENLPSIEPEEDERSFKGRDLACRGWTSVYPCKHRKHDGQDSYLLGVPLARGFTILPPAALALIINQRGDTPLETSEASWILNLCRRVAAIGPAPAEKFPPSLETISNAGDENPREVIL